jgi:acetyl esterase/lipase
LQALMLNGSAIDDDGMAAVATLNHLSELHLERTSVSDAGLARLCGLTSLRNIFLHGSQCTDEGAKALAAALPGAAVTLQKLTIPEVPGQPAVVAREPAPFERVADVIYGWKHGMALTMDVVKPSRPANGAAVVWVIGDSYYSRRESITGEIPRMDELLGRGYHVFAVTHGAAPRFNVEEAIGDVHRAVRFVRHNARSYGIDPTRIGAEGMSGAGHLALMLGTSDGLGWHFEDPIARGELAIHDPIDDESGRVGAVVCFCGLTDLRNYGELGQSILDHPTTVTYRAPFLLRDFDDQTRTYREVTDRARVDEWLARVSPVSHVSGTSAPVLFFHGEKDENVPLQQSRVMAEALRSAGVACELEIKPGAGHGWAYDPADMARVADWFDHHLGSNR